jgi:hypothetical protein
LAPGERQIEDQPVVEMGDRPLVERARGREDVAVGGHVAPEIIEASGRKLDVGGDALPPRHHGPSVRLRRIAEVQRRARHVVREQQRARRWERAAAVEVGVDAVDVPADSPDEGGGHRLGVQGLRGEPAEIDRHGEPAAEQLCLVRQPGQAVEQRRIEPMPRVDHRRRGEDESQLHRVAVREQLTGLHPEPGSRLPGVLGEEDPDPADDGVHRVGELRGYVEPL